MASNGYRLRGPKALPVIRGFYVKTGVLTVQICTLTFTDVRISATRFQLLIVGGGLLSGYRGLRQSDIDCVDHEQMLRCDPSKGRDM